MTTVAVDRPANRRSLGRIMSGVAPAGLAVQFFSFASSVTLAHVLGATVSTDAYYLGITVPVLAYTLFLGTLRQGAIPALTALDADSGAEAFNEAAGEIVRGTVALAALATTVVVVAAELLLPFVAHGHLLSETRLILLELTPYGIFGALTGVLSAVLAVRGVFVLPVLVVALESVLKIVLMLAFGRTLGVQSLVLGSLIGSGIAAAVLVLAARQKRIGLSKWGRFDSPFVRSTVSLSLPLLISLSVLQVNPIVDRTMTSQLGGGKVTALELGLRLFLVPAGLVTSLLIAPITATWAARFAEGGLPALRSSAKSVVLTGSLAVAPIVAIGFVLRSKLVGVLFAGGAYPASALHDTASVLGMIVLSMPAQALIVVLATLFVIQRNTIFPMILGFSNVALNASLNLALRPVLGVAGIALSTTITLTILAVVYAVEAHRRWRPLVGIGLRRLVVKLAAGSGVAALAAFAVLSFLPGSVGRAASAVEVVVVALAGLAAYCVVMTLSGDLHPPSVWAWIRRAVPSGRA